MPIRRTADSELAHRQMAGAAASDSRSTGPQSRPRSPAAGWPCRRASRSCARGRAMLALAAIAEAPHLERTTPAMLERLAGSRSRSRRPARPAGNALRDAGPGTTVLSCRLHSACGCPARPWRHRRAWSFSSWVLPACWGTGSCWTWRLDSTSREPSALPLRTSRATPSWAGCACWAAYGPKTSMASGGPSTTSDRRRSSTASASSSSSPRRKSPLPAIAVNALFPHQLAEICRTAGARLIHISTDCVFSGRKGGYTEDDASRCRGPVRPDEVPRRGGRARLPDPAHLDHRPGAEEATSGWWSGSCSSAGAGGAGLRAGHLQRASRPIALAAI